MRALVLSICAVVVLGACSDGTEPAPRTAPTPSEAPAPEPACPNQEAVIADISLRAGEDLPGDVDGDGAPDSVSIYFDPTGEPGCQAFVVAELREGGPLAGPLETWRSDYGLPRPTLNSLHDLDRDGTAEIVVNTGVGASTQFVGIVTEEDGVLEQVTADVQAPQGLADGMFGFGGSVGHLEAVDCAAEDMIVSSFAVPDGEVYEVTRTFFTFDGATLVRAGRRTERMPIDRIQELPEYALSPFGGCS